MEERIDMREETQDQEQEQAVPAKYSLGGGVGAFLAMGAVDVFAHLGPTGLVVAAIIGVATYRHGHEVIEQIGKEVPLPKRAPKPDNDTETVKLPLWQRALGLQVPQEVTGLRRESVTVPHFDASAVFAERVEEDQNTIGRITIEQAVAHTDRNSYEVYVGRSLTDDGVGRARRVSFRDRHMKYIGASQRGKSSLVAALLTMIAATHDPLHVQFAILDLENLTGRLFADVPHIKRLRVSGTEVRLHATDPDQVLEYLVYLVKFMEYRYQLEPNALAQQPILIVSIEEFLRLRRMFKARVASASPGRARDAAQRAYSALIEGIDALAARGLKARICLWLCAQVDYADPDLREALANVTDGMAFGLKPTAAQAAGFYESEMIATNARQKRAGQCVVETADVRDLVLAVEFDLAARLRALDAVQATPHYAPSELPFEVKVDTGPLQGNDETAVDMNVPPMRPIPLRSQATIADAYAAWQGGAAGIRKIERALNIPYNTARDLVRDMERQGLIPPQTSVGGD
jgi:hypothetical protein